MTETKWVYTFGDGAAEGKADMKNLLGGKGANLAEMCLVGVPVPPGMTITTDVCTYYYDNNHQYPADLKNQVLKALAHIEQTLGKKFADKENPLLFSVRSGARVSMPGMMDTVLNLGLNDETVEGLAKISGNAKFAYDSYRRFIQMYADVVMGVHSHKFEAVLDRVRDANGYTFDNQMTIDQLKGVIAEFKAICEKDGKPLPQDPMEQLWGGIGAVFKSWMVERAIIYRKLNNISEKWGTAVNVQAMVFGNSGDNSATGVCFSRDPATGENYFYGEYLKNAQGEDVVAGIRTPQPMTKIAKERGKVDLPCMEEEFPVLFKELCDIRAKLEAHYKDMQDMEFTIQDGKLWMLQTRNGKRTGTAALKIAVDMVREGLIDKNTAILRVDAAQLDQLLHPMFDKKAKKEVIGMGLPASPGAAVGKIVFSADDAEKSAHLGEKCVLVRVETSPEDIAGMHAAEGILTARGGMTSHAAVVARGMGKPCVSGVAELRIDYTAKFLKMGDVVLKEGDMISIDGTTGQVMKGALALVVPEMTGDFGEFMGWVDAVRTLKVRANAETPLDAKTARNFGAEGIGLCRTEHMFFDPSRINHMREMILANTEADRRKALAKLLPYQRQDFVDLFTIMEGLPVTIRLLDPPLHEFLPNKHSEQVEIAQELGVPVEEIAARTTQLHESNPMLGLRGCRLAVVYPEICEMQTQAIIEAAIEVAGKGLKVLPEIEVPLISSKKELEICKKIIDATAEKVFADTGKKVHYTVGTMIELPRAALLSGEIAEVADFYEFGTNDLTQTALGMSRDDAGSFLPSYVQKGVYDADPFASLDATGVGKLVAMACKDGRATKKDLFLGVCGEHGGDPKSIAFFNDFLDGVSCSPYRVPIARLAAAQAAVRKAKAK
ncbi:MAG: pyruvate, phosphate dikinase [Alphaproteobacteria bacterium]|nr:pyruvate, phosphate dikinase [Alphaproteobacteria bacterium]